MAASAWQFSAMGPFKFGVKVETGVDSVWIATHFLCLAGTVRLVAKVAGNISDPVSRGSSSGRALSRCLSLWCEVAESL